MTDLAPKDKNGVVIKIGDKVRRHGSNVKWLQDGEEDIVTDIVNLTELENEESMGDEWDIMVYTSKFPFPKYIEGGNFSRRLEVIK